MDAKKSFIALIAAAVLAIPLGFAAGEPANVSGLNAAPIDGQSIGLTWNSARDATGELVDHYRVYFGPQSVQTLGTGDYANQVDTANNNTSYVASGLNAGTTYYFSVTAIDVNNAESEAYSLEASATTPGGAAAAAAAAAADTTAPLVTGASAPYNTRVVVTFSEAVKLPAALPELVFTVNEQAITTNLLEVIVAAMGADGKSVTLTTAKQAANVSYEVTAGVGVTDLAGNPVVSGNTDSAVFLGSLLDNPAAQQAEASEPVAAPTEEATTPETADAGETVPDGSATASVPGAPLGCGNSEKCFYEQLRACSPVTLVQTDVKMETRRTVTPGATANDCVILYSAAAITDLNNPKTMTCTLPTAGLEARVKAVTEVEGARLFKDRAEVEKVCAGDYLETFLKDFETVDVTPPENVTNLALSFREQMQRFAVLLKWTASLNSAGDLVDQVLYMSLNRGQTYDKGKSLGATATSHEAENLEGGKEYTFKLTTKDAVGNESTGVVKSIRLPQTGAAAGLLLALSGLGAGRALWRKKR